MHLEGLQALLVPYVGILDEISSAPTVWKYLKLKVFKNRIVIFRARLSREEDQRLLQYVMNKGNQVGNRQRRAMALQENWDVVQGKAAKQELFHIFVVGAILSYLGTLLLVFLGLW